MAAVRAALLQPYDSDDALVAAVARAVLAVADRPDDTFPGDPLDVTAQALAEASAFPRYDGDGWRRLRYSDADVEVAYRKAVTRTPGDTATYDAWRAWLLNDIARLGGTVRHTT